MSKGRSWNKDSKTPRDYSKEYNAPGSKEQEERNKRKRDKRKHDDLYGECPEGTELHHINGIENDEVECVLVSKNRGRKEKSRKKDGEVIIRIKRKNAEVKKLKEVSSFYGGDADLPVSKQKKTPKDKNLEDAAKEFVKALRQTKVGAMDIRDAADFDKRMLDILEKAIDNRLKDIADDYKVYGRKKLEESNVETIGELIGVIDAIIAIKKGEKLAGVALKAASAALTLGTSEILKIFGDNPNDLLNKLGDALGLVGAGFDIVTGAKSVSDVVRSSASLPDSERTKAGYLAMLDFDDDYIKILDNNLENDLLNHLKDKLLRSQGMSVEQFDINKVLEDYLKSQFNGRTLGGAPPNPAANIKNMNKRNVAGRRVKQKFQSDIGEGDEKRTRFNPKGVQLISVEQFRKARRLPGL